MTVEQDNYAKYRGKCKPMSEALVLLNPGWRLVRGHYWCPIWRSREPHWWAVDTEGKIQDPTRLQFPSAGHGEYEEFDGVFDCEQCGKSVKEEDVYTHGNYAFCSGRCAMRCVGL